MFPGMINGKNIVILIGLMMTIINLTQDMSLGYKYLHRKADTAWRYCYKY